jgi:hypothetical protein
MSAEHYPDMLLAWAGLIAAVVVWTVVRYPQSPRRRPNTGDEA